MNLDLAWRIARLHQLIRRVWGSLALRGWKGTFRRVVEQFTIQQNSAGTADLLDINDEDLRNRRRILVIDTMVPNPARDSGSLRLCMMLRLLHNDGWHVNLLPDDGRVTSADIERLHTYGIDVHAGSVMTWLRKNGASLDAVLLCRLAIAAPYFAPCRRLAPRAMCIFDTVDLHFLREQRAAKVSGSRRMFRQSIASRKGELALIRNSDVSFVVSQVELNILKKELPGSHIELVSNIHEIHGRSAPFSKRNDLLFVGGFGHPPNEDAVRWFILDILPLLHARDPSICLHVAGDIAPETRRALEQPSVIVHGRVDDLSVLMSRCKVSVAPLRFGAGVKGKVNMAMSYGLPVVVTSIAAEGMHLTDGIDALIADSASDFAAAIWRLYCDEALWTHLSDAGITNVHQYFSPDVALDTLRRVLPTAKPVADCLPQ